MGEWLRYAGRPLKPVLSLLRSYMIAPLVSDLNSLSARVEEIAIAREDVPKPAQTVVPLPVECPSPPAKPRAGTLAELDALNAEWAERPVHERVQAVGQFLLDVDESPLDGDCDPFGPEYLGRVKAFWAIISGRADYNLQRDELSPYVDPAASVLSPSFYASGESRYAGEFLAGIGFILQQLDVRTGDRVLEYGAGEGQIALHLARLRCEVAVIDVEQRYLDGIALQARAIGAEIAVRQLQVAGRDAGWHHPESNQRWTKSHAILPLDNVASANGIFIEFFNFLPTERIVTVRFASSEETVRFSPGERREVRFDVPREAVWLEILSQTDCLAPYVGDHDQRIVGIRVCTVTYASNGWE